MRVTASSCPATFVVRSVTPHNILTRGSQIWVARNVHHFAILIWLGMGIVQPLQLCTYLWEGSIGSPF